MMKEAPRQIVCLSQAEHKWTDVCITPHSHKPTRRVESDQPNGGRPQRLRSEDSINIRAGRISNRLVYSGNIRDRGLPVASAPISPTQSSPSLSRSETH
ncbi:hypothetical protein HZ326_8850 [Fusarium oxysporum f. sp. albedinis]|nr:hypothetical protein HZ326_8850 [Fusarium oxysporum f. sp. albedinis]